MPRLGEVLRTARLQANLSLPDVEAATRVRETHIAALEDEDVSALPGRVYARAYVSKLAEFYHLDSSDVLRLLDEVYPTPANLIPPPKVRYVSTPSPITTTTILAAVLVVVVAALAFYSYRQYSAFQQSTAFAAQPVASSSAKSLAFAATPAPRAVESTPTPIPSPTPAPTPTPTREIRIEARIVDRAWLLVTVDGNQVYQGILSAGEKREWVGKNKIVVKSGNAGGVEIDFNDKKQGLMGSRGEVLEKEWTVPLDGVAGFVQ